MSIHEIKRFDDIQGTPLGFNEAGEQLYAVMLPPEVIALNVEIGLHHPELVKLLNEGMRSDAYDISSYFGIIFAYCKIGLDSSLSSHGYSVNELVEQAGRALINKREEIAVGINTIPSVQGLVQGLIDMKAEAEKIQIVNSIKADN